MLLLVKTCLKLFIFLTLNSAKRKKVAMQILLQTSVKGEKRNFSNILQKHFEKN